jgi:hypothetical protein
MRRMKQPTLDLPALTALMTRLLILLEQEQCITTDEVEAVLAGAKADVPAAALAIAGLDAVLTAARAGRWGEEDPRGTR